MATIGYEEATPRPCPADPGGKNHPPDCGCEGTGIGKGPYPGKGGAPDPLDRAFDQLIEALKGMLPLAVAAIAAVDGLRGGSQEQNWPWPPRKVWSELTKLEDF